MEKEAGIRTSFNIKCRCSTKMLINTIFSKYNFPSVCVSRAVYSLYYFLYLFAYTFST